MIPDFRRLLPLPLVLVLAGCTHVAPWERGTLARRDMAVTPNPALHQLRDHVLVSKEASQGGHHGASGGCGCN